MMYDYELDNADQKDDPRRIGEPTDDISRAIKLWLRSELLTSTYRWLRISVDGLKVRLTTNPRWCDRQISARLIMYGDCILAHRKDAEFKFIEYADPKMFEQLETFIACLLYQS